MKKLSTSTFLSKLPDEVNQNLQRSQKNYALINLANQSLKFTHKDSPSLKTPIAIAIHWYAETDRKHKKSYSSEKYRLRTISRHFGTLPVEAIIKDPSLIQDFINIRLTKVSTGTARRDAGTLQCFLNHLRKVVGLQFPDVYQHIKMPKDSEIRKFIPTEEQIYKVIGNIKDLEMRDIAFLLAETGCRRSEITNLCVGDVHCERKYIVCRDTKNGEDRKVPLSAPAISILCRILIKLAGRPDTYKLFQVSAQRLSKEFRKAADMEGLGEFVLHSLRHYRLSKFIANGHDAMLVSKVSGHKDHRMLNRYVKIEAEDLASILFD